MQNQEEVINEINDEIKKAKAEPEEFEIEITDNPAEEATDAIRSFLFTLILL